ncbi:MAG: TatD family hydrolase, partial [Gammaproteobacteria bacterium]|nr:TatD family hydrolase [Gammaproteobacteria bacterium]
EAQARLLAGQLQLAKQHRLPVILHIRKAHEDALSMLKQFKLDAGGSVHAFNGSYEQAQRYMDLGFKFGFGGAVTYDAATKLRRTLKNLPDDSLLLETDAPDMAPAMYPSKRNNPAYLPDILAVIAEIRETDPMELVRITDRNAEQLFLHTSELRNHQV